MKNTTLSLVVGMTAVMILVLLGGVASAQTNSGSDVIGITNSGPFSLVKHGGFGFGWGFGGWPYGGWGWNRGYGSGYYTYPNYGTRSEPYQTCTWTGYRWKCYNFDNGYFDNNYY